MRERSRTDDSRLARIILLAAGVLALAGCATGYSFVQPGTADAGAYYAGDGSYTAPGYYYDDGIGAYDLYDTGYGGLYAPPFTFGLGFGSACGWSCAGYYGGWPWYYGGATHGRRRHHGHHHPVATAPSPRPWLRPDHPRVPPRGVARGATAPIAVPERPTEAFASRRRLESASFAPRGIARMPRPANIPDRPTYAAPQPPAFAERPIRITTPHGFARPAAPVAAPMRVAPPAGRSSHAAPVKIP